MSNKKTREELLLLTKNELCERYNVAGNVSKMSKENLVNFIMENISDSNPPKLGSKTTRIIERNNGKVNSRTPVKK